MMQCHKTDEARAQIWVGTPESDCLPGSTLEIVSDPRARRIAIRILTGAISLQSIDFELALAKAKALKIADKFPVFKFDDYVVEDSQLMV